LGSALCLGWLLCPAKPVRCRCGGGRFSKISRDYDGCANAGDWEIYKNLLTIRRDMLEESVLSGLRADHF